MANVNNNGNIDRFSLFANNVKYHIDYECKITIPLFIIICILSIINYNFDHNVKRLNALEQYIHIDTQFEVYWIPYYEPVPYYRSLTAVRPPEQTFITRVGIKKVNKVIHKALDVIALKVVDSIFKGKYYNIESLQQYIKKSLSNLISNKGYQFNWQQTKIKLRINGLTGIISIRFRVRDRDNTIDIECSCYLLYFY